MLPIHIIINRLLVSDIYDGRPYISTLGVAEGGGQYWKYDDDDDDGDVDDENNNNNNNQAPKLDHEFWSILL